MSAGGSFLAVLESKAIATFVGVSIPSLAFFWAYRNYVSAFQADMAKRQALAEKLQADSKVLIVASTPEEKELGKANIAALGTVLNHCSITGPVPFTGRQ